VPPDPSLLPPGWYPDPRQAGSQRWFDGSEWTGHAVDADPPERMERDGGGASPGERQERRHFSSDEHSTTGEGEARYEGGGGGQGLHVNRVGRGVLRAGARWGPVRASRWLGGLTLLLVLCALGDPAHRVFLAPAAAVSLVATVFFSVREARERAYWRRVGRNG
jgi:hypothetical protein